MHIPKYRRTGSGDQAERTPAASADDRPTPQRSSTSQTTRDQMPRQARAAALVEQGQRPRVAGLPSLPTEVWGQIARYIDVQRRETLPVALALFALGGAKRLTAAFAGLGVDDARMIASHPTLTMVDLSGNRIGREGAQALAANRKFEVLLLRRCEVGDQAMQAFEHNTTIRKLDVRGNAIANDGAAALARNGTLTELDASDNLIDDDGVLALAANTLITRLRLKNNFFGDRGALALASSETLIELDLGGNAADGGADPDDGIANTGALMERFAKNRTIKSLGLGHLNITDADLAKLATNQSIVALDLSSNCFTDAGAIALAAHPTVTSLDLRDNCIEEAGVMAILANPRITTLDLRNNFPTPRAKAALEEARHRFKRLDF